MLRTREQKQNIASEADHCDETADLLSIRSYYTLYVRNYTDVLSERRTQYGKSTVRPESQTTIILKCFIYGDLTSPLSSSDCLLARTYGQRNYGVNASILIRLRAARREPICAFIYYDARTGRSVEALLVEYTREFAGQRSDWMKRV